MKNILTPNMRRAFEQHQARLLSDAIKALPALSGATAEHLLSEGGLDALANGIQLALQNLQLQVVSVHSAPADVVVDMLEQEGVDTVGDLRLTIRAMVEALEFYSTSTPEELQRDGGQHARDVVAKHGAEVSHG